MDPRCCIPAAILIQKRARGMIIRERFCIAALRQHSALLIQTIVRGWSRRLEFPRIKLRALKLKKIVVMQCFARKVYMKCHPHISMLSEHKTHRITIYTLILTQLVRYLTFTTRTAICTDCHAKTSGAALPPACPHSCYHKSSRAFSHTSCP